MSPKVHTCGEEREDRQQGVSDLHFYEEILMGEQNRGLHGCLSLDPCLLPTEHRLLSLLTCEVFRG